MIKKEVGMLTVFGALFLFSITMLLVQNISFEETSLTGYAVTGTTVSNVTISKYLSIAMSSNLSAGIAFGSADTLPAINLNATANNNSEGDTTLFINISSDSNTGVDFCIKADADLYDSVGDNTLAAGNESFANATSASGPVVGNEVSLITAEYVWAGNQTVGNDIYYRFWLDIPAATESGTYNNTITFKGVEVNGGVGC